MCKPKPKWSAHLVFCFCDPFRLLYRCNASYIQEKRIIALIISCIGMVVALRIYMQLYKRTIASGLKTVLSESHAYKFVLTCSSPLP